MIVSEAKIRIYNFDYMRIIFAWLVLFSHTYAIVYGSASSLLFTILPAGDIGYFSVLAFFTLSGFLITESFTRQKSPLNFLEARFLRIYPGYLVVVLVATFLVGPIWSKLSALEYLSSEVPYKYFVYSMLQRANFNLPGLFESNPYAHAVNGSLWTIYYELRVYILTFILGICGLFKTKSRATVSFFVLVLLLPLYHGHYSLERMSGLKLDVLKIHLAYLLGTVAFFYRDVIFNRFVPLVIMICLSIFIPSVYLRVTTFSYAILFLGLNPKLQIRKGMNIPDFSYGLYLYAFLVQQVLIAQFPQITFYTHLLLSTVISIFLGLLSYYKVELPALRYRYRFFRSIANFFKNSVTLRKPI